MNVKEYNKVHLICGPAACGKTTLFRQIIQYKLNSNKDVCVVGFLKYNNIYFW